MTTPVVRSFLICLVKEYLHTLLPANSDLASQLLLEAVSQPPDRLAFLAADLRAMARSGEVLNLDDDTRLRHVKSLIGTREHSAKP